MLETIREFALERLAASGEMEELRTRHLEHFRNLAEEAEPQLTRENRGHWAVRLEADHDNLRAALDWAERTGDADAGLRTAAAVWRFWLQRGHLSEGRDRLQRVLSMPEARIRSPARSRALSALGGITYWQNDYPPMRAAYQEAVDIAREVGDKRLLASALLDLSFAPYIERDHDRVEPILREGLAVAQEAGDRILTAQFWSSMGFLEFLRGNPIAALQIRATAIEIYREEGQVWELAQEMSGQAMISRMAGDLDGAERHARESLELVVQANDTLSISMGFLPLAHIANDLGQHERAARLLGAAARIRDELGGGIPPELGGQWGDPVQNAQQALGEDAYLRARAEGYAMDTDEAVGYALKDDPEHSSTA
jgi:tetratricopeptide (TPR) repeat protein